MKISQEHVANEQILRRYRTEGRNKPWDVQVVVIGAEGERLGTMTIRDALAMAKQEGLDLVEMSHTATPPVCRITDYGKLKYDQKKSAANGHRQPSQDVKELRLSPNMAENDLRTRINQAIKFLSERRSVKVILRFRAREITHPEIGRAVLDKFTAALDGKGTIDGIIRSENKLLTAIYKPSRTGKEKTVLA